MVTTKHPACTIVRMSCGHTDVKLASEGQKVLTNTASNPRALSQWFTLPSILTCSLCSPLLRLGFSVVHWASPVFCTCPMSLKHLPSNPEACGKCRGLAPASHSNCFLQSAAGLQSCRMRSLLVRCTYADHTPGKIQ